MSGSPAVLEISGAVKCFGSQTALDRVDLRVGTGRIHGLVGPNGAGKTTLLAALFGLVRLDEGQMRLFGRTPAEAGAGWLDGVGGFIEAPRFYPYLTGRQNLTTLAALDGGEAGALVDQVLATVGLVAVADRRVKGYSLGMRQRLGLGAALLRRPRLLILDEPTNGMDPAGIRDLRGALRDLADRGLSVVLASHDMAQVEQLCDDVTVLHRGRVAFTGTLHRMRREAPDPAWRVRTSDDERAEELAGAFDELKVTAGADGLVAVAAQEALDRWVVDLGRAGVAVRALSLDVTPLELLFFELTERNGSTAVGATGDETSAVEGAA